MRLITILVIPVGAINKEEYFKALESFNKALIFKKMINFCPGVENFKQNNYKDESESKTHNFLESLYGLEDFELQFIDYSQWNHEFLPPFIRHPPLGVIGIASSAHLESSGNLHSLLDKFNNIIESTQVFSSIPLVSNLVLISPTEAFLNSQKEELPSFQENGGHLLFDLSQNSVHNLIKSIKSTIEEILCSIFVVLLSNYLHLQSYSSLTQISSFFFSNETKQRSRSRSRLRTSSSLSDQYLIQQYFVKGVEISDAKLLFYLSQFYSSSPHTPKTKENILIKALRLARQDEDEIFKVIIREELNKLSHFKRSKELYVKGKYFQLLRTNIEQQKNLNCESNVLKKIELESSVCLGYILDNLESNIVQEKEQPKDILTQKERKESESVSSSSDNSSQVQIDISINKKIESLGQLVSFEDVFQLKLFRKVFKNLDLFYYQLSLILERRGFKRKALLYLKLSQDIRKTDVKQNKLTELIETEITPSQIKILFNEISK